jgi:hypothetical protein
MTQISYHQKISKQKHMKSKIRKIKIKIIIETIDAEFTIKAKKYNLTIDFSKLKFDNLTHKFELRENHLEKFKHVGKCHKYETLKENTYETLKENKIDINRYNKFSKNNYAIYENLKLYLEYNLSKIEYTDVILRNRNVIFN